MTAAGSDSAGVTSEPCVTNLHTLSISLEMLRRLLDRRADDGALVPADPVLVGQAITAGHQELQHVQGMLEVIRSEAAGPCRAQAEALIAIVGKLGSLLDTIEGSLDRLSRR